MMSFQSVPEVIPVGIAGVLSAALAAFAWRRRATPGAPAFVAMMAGETAWALGAAFEPIIVELPLKRLCIDVRLFGTLTAILSLMAFTFRYTGRHSWLEPRRFAALCAPAALLLLVAWTDRWHHLYWSRLSNEQLDGVWIATREFGPGFWATVAYCYFLAATATVLLARAVVQLRGVYRTQSAVMLFGVLLPWTVDILDMSRVWGFIPVDFVSMSFAVTGLTFLPALFRFRLLDLAPMAWAAVVELMNDPVVVIDRQGRVAALNPAAQRLVGRPARDVLGAGIAEVFGFWEELADRLRRIDDQHGVSFEIEGADLDSGHAFQVSLSRLDDTGESIGWVLVVRDITEARGVERERAQMLSEQAARAQAEAANRAKDRFLAALSHELRTPLTPVLATVTAMLSHDSTPPAVRPVFEMIRRNIEVEARLIDDLLDLTRIERGEFPLRREVIDVHERIDRVLEICGGDAHNAGVTLISQLRAEAHHLDADPTRFLQVLWNLIRNAIKFTPRGAAVTVRSRNRFDPPPGGTGETHLVIEVIDQGMGITPDLLPRLFTPFEQGGPSIGRRFGGLGLGLAISRSIVEQHGGRLSVSSEGEGRGATFTVEMFADAKPTPASSVAPTDLIAHRPLKLLVVEDNLDTLRYLAAMLSRRGHDVRTAATCADALREVEEHEFDVLISDIELPDGTGLELMERLQAETPLPGIALSGFGSPEDVEMSRSAGFSEHLTKPVEFGRLEEAILRAAPDPGWGPALQGVTSA